MGKDGQGIQVHSGSNPQYCPSSLRKMMPRCCCQEGTHLSDLVKVENNTKVRKMTLFPLSKLHTRVLQNAFSLSLQESGNEGLSLPELNERAALEEQGMGRRVNSVQGLHPTRQGLPAANAACHSELCAASSLAATFYKIPGLILFAEPLTGPGHILVKCTSEPMNPTLTQFSLTSGHDFSRCSLS